MEKLVSISMIILLVYILVGMIFSIPFLIKGISKVDSSTHNTPWSFKLIIWPGVILFWPVLLAKWLNLKS